MATYTLLSSNVLTTTAASVTFSSIPATYTDLIIRMSTRDDRVDTQNPINMTLNNNTSAVYSLTRLGGNGTSVSSASSFNQTSAQIYYENSTNSTSNTFTSSEFYIPNYAAFAQKPLSAVTATERNLTEAFIHANAILFNDTTAISSFTLTPVSANFVAGSSFYLYGVFDGPETLPSTPTIGTATATGGTTATVAFTPTSATNVDASYTALSTPGSITATGTSSPVTVSGLTEGTAYTFQVRANNPGGSSAYSAASNSVTPTIPGAYESIATLTPTSGTQVQFTSIPSGYASLQLRINLFTPSNQDYPVFRFNNDSGTNYSLHYWATTGGGTAAGGTGAASSFFSTLAPNGTSPTRPNVIIIDIFDYASTTKYKTVKSFGGTSGTDGTGVLNVSGAQWRSNDAITSILMSQTFGSGTSIALYGIKGA